MFSNRPENLLFRSFSFRFNIVGLPVVALRTGATPQKSPLTVQAWPAYHIYRFGVTKNELNQRGTEIPTAWLLIVPFVNLYWLWRFAEGVEKVLGFSAIG